MLMHGLYQTITQAICRYNGLVHGLLPPRGVGASTPHESEEVHRCLVGRNLGQINVAAMVVRL